MFKGFLWRVRTTVVEVRRGAGKDEATSFPVLPEAAVWWANRSWGCSCPPSLITFNRLSSLHAQSHTGDDTRVLEKKFSDQATRETHSHLQLANCLIFKIGRNNAAHCGPI